MQNREQIKKEIAAWGQNYGKDRSALISILHEIQKKYRYVSPMAMQLVADQLNIHPVEVQNVVSFYHFFTLEPKGRFIIRMCHTMPCIMNSAREVANEFERVLQIKFGETTPDENFSLEWTSCIGMCDQGPAVLVNEKPYTKLTVDMVAKIIVDYRKLCKN